MPTGDLDSENPTAAPFLVDEAAAAPWVMVLAGTVVAGIVLISIVFPEITVSIVEAAIAEAGVTVDVIPPTDASSVIGMALPTPVAVHWGGMESVAVLGLADSSFE
jgi:hypothetical protein